MACKNRTYNNTLQAYFFLPQSRLWTSTKRTYVQETKQHPSEPTHDKLNADKMADMIAAGATHNYIHKNFLPKFRRFSRTTPGTIKKPEFRRKLGDSHRWSLARVREVRKPSLPLCEVVATSNIQLLQLLVKHEVQLLQLLTPLSALLRLHNTCHLQSVPIPPFLPFSACTTPHLQSVPIPPFLPFSACTTHVSQHQYPLPVSTNTSLPALLRMHMSASTNTPFLSVPIPPFLPFSACTTPHLQSVPIPPSLPFSACTTHVSQHQYPLPVSTNTSLPALLRMHNTCHLQSVPIPPFLPFSACTTHVTYSQYQYLPSCPSPHAQHMSLTVSTNTSLPALLRMHNTCHLQSVSIPPFLPFSACTTHVTYSQYQYLPSWPSPHAQHTSLTVSINTLFLPFSTCTTHVTYSQYQYLPPCPSPHAQHMSASTNTPFLPFSACTTHVTYCWYQYPPSCSSLPAQHMSQSVSIPPSCPSLPAHVTVSTNTSLPALLYLHNTCHSQYQYPPSCPSLSAQHMSLTVRTNTPLLVLLYLHNTCHSQYQYPPSCPSLSAQHMSLTVRTNTPLLVLLYLHNTCHSQYQYPPSCPSLSAQHMSQSEPIPLFLSFSICTTHVTVSTNTPLLALLYLHNTCHLQSEPIPLFLSFSICTTHVTVSTNTPLLALLYLHNTCHLQSEPIPPFLPFSICTTHVTYSQNQYPPSCPSLPIRHMSLTVRTNTRLLVLLCLYDTCHLQSEPISPFLPFSAYTCHFANTFHKYYHNFITFLLTSLSLLHSHCAPFFLSPCLFSI